MPFSSCLRSRVRVFFWMEDLVASSTASPTAFHLTNIIYDNNNLYLQEGGNSSGHRELSTWELTASNLSNWQVRSAPCVCRYWRHSDFMCAKLAPGVVTGEQHWHSKRHLPLVYVLSCDLLDAYCVTNIDGCIGVLVLDYLVTGDIKLFVFG